MVKKTGVKRNTCRKRYRWDDLKSRIGQEQLQFYRNLLVHLGADNQKLVQAFNVNTTITQPKQLTNWSAIWIHWTGTTARTVSHAMTSAICTKAVAENANETKSGAGQYFTPRPLIKTIIHLLKPQLVRSGAGPAAGTAGFFTEADRYVKSQTNDLDDLDGDTQDFQIHRAFIGLELVPGTRRLARMNCLLHDIEKSLTDGGVNRLAMTW